MDGKRTADHIWLVTFELMLEDCHRIMNIRAAKWLQIIIYSCTMHGPTHIYIDNMNRETIKRAAIKLVITLARQKLVSCMFSHDSKSVSPKVYGICNQ